MQIFFAEVLLQTVCCLHSDGCDFGSLIEGLWTVRFGAIAVSLVCRGVVCVWTLQAFCAWVRCALNVLAVYFCLIFIAGLFQA